MRYEGKYWCMREYILLYVEIYFPLYKSHIGHAFVVHYIIWFFYARLPLIDGCNYQINVNILSNIDNLDSDAE